VTDPSFKRRLLLQAGAAALLVPVTETRAAPAGLITRAIPRSGERLPAIGIGTYQVFDLPQSQLAGTELQAVLKRFVELGGAVVDSSPMYGHAEATTGILSSALNARKSLFFATKVWTSGREAGIRQMEDSFRLMQTKTIDLMQVHNLLDLKVHLPVLRDWKKAGRIRYLGITHYHAGAHAEVEKLVKTGDFDFVQINYSMDEPEAEARLLPACADSGTATLINRPFSQAGLFGKVRGKPLPPWCADIDCSSWAQFFLKWIISHPEVTCAIPGTGRVAHIEDNMAACTGRLPGAALRKKMTAYFSTL
jgi:diketogulonate reductase-like aldo/keto reductase